MTDLLWPGAQRAGGTFSDTAFLAAMVRVEEAWLTVLGSPLPLEELVGEDDLAALALGAEDSGNPVVGLAALLRERSGEHRLHRGLTSQDVVDSALMVLLRDTVDRVQRQVLQQVAALEALAQEHRRTLMAGRTLTQHAVPTTFGLKAAGWLTAVLDAWDDLAALSFPVQLGGAAGTMAAAVEAGIDPVAARLRLATTLGLAPTGPWHTTRRPVTRVGDALVACTDGWGRIANDVLTLSRPEIGELSEAVGGGSSTMPHKQNPVLAVLLRRASLTTPQLAATLHTAAADQADERAAGAWHAEWSTLQTLARRVLVAATQATDLIGSLRVDPKRMRATAEAAADDLRAEQRSLAAPGHHEPLGDYLGAADVFIDEVRDRARLVLAASGRTP
ncbi:MULTISPECIES: lyase family protein [Nocardioides]|uniref:Lyase family protein n=1 Tax=Nocardioides vastitatis TaxID=2568655 RepID=A0ABW0ZIM1_9ACTN|nr:lyase family protein [Nocardioides sp.]THJ04330.1 3-carboxy-cis,cis-muconate cycloisomerase [Nocardioides sp.]